MTQKKLYAVIGDPVAHSLSPAMHNAAFRSLDLPHEYVAVHVKKEDMADFIEDAKKRLAGFNVTVPHKKNVMEYLSSCPDTAKVSESINTVTVLHDGSLAGESTDGYGFETAVRESLSVSLDGASVCFIGCGGVAQALAVHCAARGVKKIMILNRTLEKASSLAERLKDNFPSCEVEFAGTSDADKTAVFLEKAHLAVQCTSLGLHEDDPSPIEPELLLSGKAALFETIYKETKLLSFARSHSIKCSDGLGMLLHQGAKSFSTWTGLEAPVEVMRSALLSAAGRVR